MARSRAPKRIRRCMVAVRYRGAMTRAEALFEEELRRRGFLFVRSDVSTYQIVLGDGRVTVSLENVARYLERDDDPDRLVRFADSVLGTLVPLPGWDAARENVYWIVEDRAHDLIGVVHEALTEGVVRILAHADFEAGRIRWLTPRSIADWNVEPADVSKAAWQNLDRALASAELHVEGDGEVSLGILVMPDRLTEALKASLILAPAFEAFVATKLGWPVLAVIPCRDYVYLLAEKDACLLTAEMGAQALHEYRSSGYPITLEVLCVLMGGVESIGRFPDGSGASGPSSGDVKKE